MRIAGVEPFLEEVEVDALSEGDEVLAFGLDDDDFPTHTSDLQRAIEMAILPHYVPYKYHQPPEPLSKLQLFRNAHVRYVLSGMEQGGRFVSLDASKPWMVYWLLQSLDLLGADLPQSLRDRAIHTLRTCQHETGGFGGGPGQLSHLAATYAAVNALAIIGTEEAYDVVDRAAMLSYLKKMKMPDGSFVMHEGGETDVRGTYCAMNVCKLLNIIDPILVDNAAEFIVRCQSYEGGISGCPGAEAHGGYTFCALAAMEMLKKSSLLDLDSLTLLEVALARTRRPGEATQRKFGK
ncbi:hypothetical protein HK104_007290 [Borealophlyctis nickersoniae]|nr:hypothetical protein HK104_007290 [Borealophlyctis nickersoniae]